MDVIQDITSRITTVFQTVEMNFMRLQEIAKVRINLYPI